MPQTTIKDCMGRIASLEGTIEKMATMQAQLLNHLTQPVKAEPQQQTITNVAQAMPKADDHLAIFIEQMKVYRKANGLRKRQGVKMQIAADHLTRLMGTQVEDWT